MNRFVSDEELRAIPIGAKWVFDIEVYRNFTFIAFERLDTNETVVFVGDENTPIQLDKLNWLLGRGTFIGFNSANYDLLILAAVISGADSQRIKDINDQIIIDKVRSFGFEKKFKMPLPNIRHIDVMEVCPLKGGLKTYAARLHAAKIQELPISADRFLSAEEKVSVGNYCLNDLQLTKLIYNELSEQFKLREVMSERYGVDLNSKSDAQIAERVIGSELSNLTGTKVPKQPELAPGTPFRFTVQPWMGFASPALQTLLTDIGKATFSLGESGAIESPPELRGRKVHIGKATYTVGIGGLHSTEKCQTVKANQDSGMLLVDRDVASYYPAIVLNQGLYPEHLGPNFLEVYASIVEQRLAAKRAGLKADADSLKIVINGSFGKFGSKYSILYSPQLVIQVTLTGQIALLMLIEAAEQRGMRVVSANTDGMVFHIPDHRKAELDALIASWEAHTKFETEETLYQGLYSRDVNNYIAIKGDGKAKTKGAFLLPEGSFKFHKNPDANIVTLACIEYLRNGTMLEKTIGECQDIREFIVVRSVTDGANWTGEYVGKVCRWYYSRHCSESLTNAKSGDKVPNSEGARPCQVLPTSFPEDVDFGYYLSLAQKALVEMGAVAPESDLQFLFSREEMEALDGCL